MYIQVTNPSEPPKFPDTSTIEVEEKPEPEEPLEWYLLGLRYLDVLSRHSPPPFLYLCQPTCTYTCLIVFVPVYLHVLVPTSLYP